MQKKAIIGLAVTLAVIAAFISAVVLFGPDSGEIKELEAVEVKEYQGEKLSSINDFRENSIRGPQYVDAESYQLSIAGLVAKPQAYSYDEVIKQYESYRKVVRLNCVEGWAVNILWEGVLVRDLLEQAQPLAGAKVVIFHAYDGYTTSFPLAYLTDNDILLADKMNGVTLPPQRGFPFQLVAEDKWGYKWIKWITAIELSDNVDYRGYWESGGYAASGDLDRSFFD